jgi:hypothetical protein
MCAVVFLNLTNVKPFWRYEIERFIPPIIIKFLPFLSTNIVSGFQIAYSI